MKNNLRRNFERFCHRNRGKGIRDLMLYICLGNAIVALAGMINGGAALSALLCFDKAAILRGEVWRLVSWLFTDQLGGSMISILFLYFFYRLGNQVEQIIGTFKFNLFYLSGVVMMDLFAMIFCPTEPVIIGNYIYPPEAFTYFYGNMAYYLHLSMVLAYSTIFPEAQFLIFYVIPIKAWIIALLDLIMIAISVYNMCYPDLLFPHCLFPLIGLLNYFLFFGSSMKNLLPFSIKARRRRNQFRRGVKAKVVPFPETPVRRADPVNSNYTHRCTVCGKTDAEYPDLEFRYCSRCQGYHCYCEEHISNHAHIE